MNEGIRRYEFFFTRITKIVNQMKSSSAENSSQKIIEKFLIS